MPIVTVPVTSSTRKKTIYNPNQRVNSKTVGNIPGLEDDLVLYPKSIAMLIRELFGALPADKQFFNGNVESFNTTEIVTKEGAYLVGDDIYYLEALTLAPTAAGFWGFFEIELESIDSDPASLQFFDVSTNTLSQQTVNTRKSFNIKVYENYNTTASFPTLTPGRIKWIEFKKDAAFGNIIEVTKLLNSVVFPNDKSGTVALLEDQTFIGLNDTPGSYTGQKGRVPVVNQLENGIIFQQQFGLLDSKWSSRKFSPSPSEPWFRKDLDHTFNISNWPLLVPELRNTKWEFGSTSIFNVTGFTPGTVTRLQLEDALVVRNLVRALLEDYHYSKSYTASTNADTVDDDSAFSNWGMIVRIVTDIGTGINAPKANQEFRIRYLTSLANTLSITNRFICIDKDTSASATTGSGTIEITPYRIASAGVPNPNQARWRKRPESGLMTPGSTFYSGTDLVEVPANSRVRDRAHKHRHFFGYADGDNSLINISPLIGDATSIYGDTANNWSNKNVFVNDMRSTGIDGDIRGGPSTRVRSGVEYLYGNGVIYIA
ncbi:unnamed protein product [Leptospira phage LE1]|uniref:Uncharacterized protein n=1 Tax=Leptospira phage LE1 TaxID=137511 RepID=Q6NDZ7_9CAUD|nr:hypothetical protein HWD53_gp46 [Leptospira phage LE1]CAE14734.1 unnamed protein product [Leptospira phage LE1]